MKSYNEIQYYLTLKTKMQSKADSLNVTWSSYYADLLNLGGQNNAQYLRNYFLKDDLKFTHEQLAIIHNDLENYTNIKPITENEIKDTVLRFVAELGSLSSSITSILNGDNEVSSNEASKLSTFTRRIFKLSKELHFRLIETKHSK